MASKAGTVLSVIGGLLALLNGVVDLATGKPLGEHIGLESVSGVLGQAIVALGIVGLVGGLLAIWGGVRGKRGYVIGGGVLGILGICIGSVIAVVGGLLIKEEQA